MKNHLVAVTGMSPAVVTETLYGIQRDGLPWPHSISILTTAHGQQQLAETLPGAITALCAEYQQALPDLKVHVIPGGDGKPIKDARSLADHEALGDYIMRHVRDLTRVQEQRVHASIAGGRKTMTYYLGYAMSLFGRPQDRLSHVLVSEGYENLPGFFYPTRTSQPLRTPQGETLDASRAEVVLADIPFLRLRDRLPRNLLNDDVEVHFRQLIRCISLGDEEAHQQRLWLTLPAERPGLIIGERDDQGQVEKVLEIPLKPVDYAFYRALVRAQIGREPLWQRDDQNQGDPDQAIEICCELALLNGARLDRNAALSQVVDDLQDLDGPNRPDPRTLEALSRGVTGTLFSQRVSSIRKQLEACLPWSLMRWLEPRVIADAEGVLHGFYGVDFPLHQSKRGGFGIALRSDAITLEQ